MYGTHTEYRNTHPQPNLFASEAQSHWRLGADMACADGAVRTAGSTPANA
jgi:hypothetical protein